MGQRRTWHLHSVPHVLILRSECLVASVRSWVPAQAQYWATVRNTGPARSQYGAVAILAVCSLRDILHPAQDLRHHSKCAMAHARLSLRRWLSVAVAMLLLGAATVAATLDTTLAETEAVSTLSLPPTQSWDPFLSPNRESGIDLVGGDWRATSGPVAQSPTLPYSGSPTILMLQDGRYKSDSENEPGLPRVVRTNRPGQSYDSSASQRQKNPHYGL